MSYDEETTENEEPEVTPAKYIGDQAYPELETENGRERTTTSARDINNSHATGGGSSSTATGGSVELHIHHSSSETIHQPSSEVEEPERRMKDLTVSLDQPHAEVGTEQQAWYNILLQEKVLVLTCPDNKILFSAGYSVAMQFEGEKRFMTFKETEERLQEITIDTLLACKKLWADSALILVDATGPQAQGFVESIVGKHGWFVESTSLLRTHRCWLLILTKPTYLPPGEEVTFPHYSVSFVEPRLREILPEQATALAREIYRQRDLGLWGRDEEEFWGLFRNVLKPDLLPREIEKRNDPKNVPTKTASSLVNLKAELETSALFLAAFFPKLSFEEFDDLLICLLGDRLRPAKTIALGEDHAVDQAVEIPQTLAEEWHENYSEICQRCHLIFWRDPTSSTMYGAIGRGVVVAFDAPELREQVREEFLTKHYPALTRLFLKILDKRALFHSSPSVVEGTLQLLQTMASLNPQRYGSELLLSFKLTSQDEGPAAKELRNGVPKQIDSKVLQSRLYLVIRALLREESLREVVHQFFTDLINHGRHEDLLELVRRLRFAAGFNQVYWWKQLLDRGQTEAREKAYRGMLAILQSGGGQFQEILLEIRSWLPDSGLEVKSESARRGNGLLRNLLEASIIRSRDRHTSVGPQGDVLRSALCDTRPDAKSSPILSWLFHASFVQQAQEYIPRHLNIFLWTWVLNRPVKRYLHADANGIASHWFSRFLELPARSFPFTATPSALVFHALVLGDLASSLRTLKLSGTEGYTENTLRPIAETVRKLCTEEQSLLLESYWGEMMNLLLEVHAAIRPQGGIEDETFRATRTRLEEQYEGIAEFKEIFGEVVSQQLSTGE